jgi:hypothetical protein
MSLEEQVEAAHVLRVQQGELTQATNALLASLWEELRRDPLAPPAP